MSKLAIEDWISSNLPIFVFLAGIFAMTLDPINICIKWASMSYKYDDDVNWWLYFIGAYGLVGTFGIVTFVSKIRLPYAIYECLYESEDKPSFYVKIIEIIILISFFVLGIIAINYCNVILNNLGDIRVKVKVSYINHINVSIMSLSLIFYSLLAILNTIIVLQHKIKNKKVNVVRKEIKKEETKEEIKKEETKEEVKKPIVPEKK